MYGIKKHMTNCYFDNNDFNMEGTNLFTLKVNFENY